MEKNYACPGPQPQAFFDGTYIPTLMAFGGGGVAVDDFNAAATRLHRTATGADRLADGQPVQLQADPAASPTAAGTPDWAAANRPVQDAYRTTCSMDAHRHGEHGLLRPFYPRPLTRLRDTGSHCCARPSTGRTSRIYAADPLYVTEAHAANREAVNQAIGGRQKTSRFQPQTLPDHRPARRRVGGGSRRWSCNRYPAGAGFASSSWAPQRQAAAATALGWAALAT